MDEVDALLDEMDEGRDEDRELGRDTEDALGPADMEFGLDPVVLVRWLRSLILEVTTGPVDVDAFSFSAGVAASAGFLPAIRFGPGVGVLIVLAFILILRLSIWFLAVGVASPWFCIDAGFSILGRALPALEDTLDMTLSRPESDIVDEGRDTVCGVEMDD